MSRVLQFLVVVVLVTVLPLRAVAGMTIGFCASGHKEMALEVHLGGQGHEARDHVSHAVPADDQPFSASCNICSEHCSGTFFAFPTVSEVQVQASRNDRTHFAERNAPAFIPDQPDRPPPA